MTQLDKKMSPHNPLSDYHKLKPLGKALVRLVALACAGTPVHCLRKCLPHLSNLDEVDQDVKNDQLIGVLESLKEKRLVESWQRAPRRLAHMICVDVMQSEYAGLYLKAIQTVQEEVGFDRFYAHSSYETADFCELRRAIYAGNEPAIEMQLKHFVQKYGVEELQSHFYAFFALGSVELEWLVARPPVIQQYIFSGIIDQFCVDGYGFDRVAPLLEHYQSKQDAEGFRQSFLNYNLLACRLDLIHQSPKSAIVTSADECVSAAATRLFLLQDNATSLKQFAAVLRALRRQEGRRKIFLPTVHGLFYMLALLRQGNEEGLAKLQQILNIVLDDRYPYGDAYIIMQDVLWMRQGRESRMEDSQDREDSYENMALCELNPVTAALKALSWYWFEGARLDIQQCVEQFDEYQESMPLIAKIFAEILVQRAPDKDRYKTFLQQNIFKGVIDFTSIVDASEKWERRLLQLTQYLDSRSGAGANSSPKRKRLAWSFDPGCIENLTAFEQTLKIKGGWTRGRMVSLKRLKEEGSGSSFDYLIPQDHKIIQTICKESSWYRYSSSPYCWDKRDTLLALTGHPAIISAENPDLPIELTASVPELIVEECDEGYLQISLSQTATEAKVILEQETPSRYKVIDFSEDFVPLVEIISATGLKVPKDAKDNVMSVIQKAAPLLPIQSELDGDNLTAVEGDCTPCLQLMPVGQGLRVNLFVRPFTDQGPYLRPGHGKAIVLSLSEGGHVKARRDLKQEKQHTLQFIEECSSFRLANDGSYEWILDEPHMCLEMLSEVAAYQGPLRTEWPEGQKFSVTAPVAMAGLSLKIRQKQDWFEVDGEIKVSEDQVLNMRALLDLLDHAEGHFVPLEDNKFLHLTKHFKKRLLDLKTMSEMTKSGAKVHGLGSLMLRDFIEEVGVVKSDKHWKQQLKSLAEVEKYQPKLPRTLQADLREYQVEGFQWLARLAHAGMGACLADDMGLGKTVQALAVMISQAGQGPCLVVAPTSVCHNWVDEIAKFAPTLNAHIMPLKNRKKFVESLGVNDVLICSYGIMQQEADVMVDTNWQMVVLDEAQAIKNPATKRTQVAIKLQGQFKLALTGTPIENDLEELWSLFRFVAPGLLGSLESFRKRFVIPVQRTKNLQVRDNLRALVQTFILRRTKNKVLTELPPRTEQNLIVEMADEERAFYEALRHKAIERIQALDEESQGGQKRFHILAEMTRLRQACCHPQLVSKEAAVKSSKLKVLMRLIEDLRQNNHQALVFSQYVGYLKLVRQELDSEGIGYQYLDGSTPAASRRQEIQAFQSGASDLFLISLRAGGAGLNLTAADYVIHLDPWWNPAVEDQASDRAHRIGQTRPVTIYRLIMQNSIEEKIIALHAAKRDLADGLLKGSDVWQRLSEEQLIGLIQESSGSLDSQKEIAA